MNRSLHPEAIESLKPYFDPSWYLKKYPDVAEAGQDAWKHYQAYGFAEGRVPCFVEALDLERLLWFEADESVLHKLEELRALTGDTFQSPIAAWVLARWYDSLERWDLVEYYLASIFDKKVSDLVIERQSSNLLYFSALYYQNKLSEAGSFLLHPSWEHNADYFLAQSMLSSPTQKLDLFNYCWIESGVNSLIPIQNTNELCFDLLADYDVMPEKKVPLLKRIFDTISLPLVSVIIPCFNSEKTIATALSSLLKQTWRKLEILVVDDASTDDSIKVIESFVRKDSRVKLIRHEKNQGAYVARNTALAMSKGALITTHDADDWSHPQKIELQVNALLANKSCKASVSHWARCHEDLSFTRWRMEGGWVYRNVSSLMFKRSVFKQLGFWDRVSVSADTEYYYRLQKVFGSSSIVEVLLGVPLSFGRLDANSLTGQSSTHLRTLFKGLRRDYHEAAFRWHENSDITQLFLPQFPKKRPFLIPALMCRGTEQQVLDRRYQMLLNSECFDQAWYLSRYEDVALSGDDPLMHYLLHGAYEGRDPSQHFSSSGYAFIKGINYQQENALVYCLEQDLSGFDRAESQGGIEWKTNQEIALVVAHSVSGQCFGAERSLLEVLQAFKTLSKNVIVVLPSAKSTDYVNRVLELSNRAVILPYRWWQRGRRVDEGIVSAFEGLITEFQPDLIYVNTLVLFEPLLAAKKKDIKIWLHVRELPEEDKALCLSLNADAGQVCQHALEYCDVFIANSQFLASWYRKKQASENCNIQFVTIYNTVDCELLMDLLSPKQNQHLPIIGMLSSNLLKKGIEDVFDLAVRLGEFESRCIINIFGPLTVELENLLQRHAETNLVKVVYAGYVANPVEALVNIDIVLNVSHFKESFGRSVLEAMFAARPVITYRSRRNRSKKLILKARSSSFLSYPSFSGNQIPFVHYEPIFGLPRQHYRCQLL